MEKLTTIEMIQEIINDRRKKFKSKDARGNEVVASFKRTFRADGIFLEHKNINLVRVLEVTWGHGEVGIMTWLWEEVGQTDWSKVAIDTKVLVSDNGATWEKRYFSKYENNEIVTWGDGSTSWSATYEISWKYAKLAE